MITDETRKKWDEKIECIFECLSNNNTPIECNRWEVEFLDSIQLLRSKGNDLTHKQVKVLNRIYERIG